MHNFKPGQLFLFDKKRQVEMVLDYYMEEGEVGLVLQRMGRKENRKNAELWGKVLGWVVGRAGGREGGGRRKGGGGDGEGGGGEGSEDGEE